MKPSILLLLATLCFSIPVKGQKANFSYKFYGFVRGDLFYNTRATMAPVDGNFYLYPLDKLPDAEGKDINAGPNGSFYTFTSRLGLDVKGPQVGTAKTSAKVETDFGGFSKNVALLRIRQAYVALDWEKHQLLIGQTWHPLFGSVFPDILNLSTGAPFQPFNRSPQLRYQYKTKEITLTASAIWQMQYTSSGPDGMSEDYMKNSCMPEFYLGADWQHDNGWIAGAGAHLISLSPRKQSALDHTALLGGYGIHSVDSKNGKQEYTAFRQSTSWINFTYGQKWKPALFVGYTKNLGTGQSLADTETLYGMGLDIDQLLITNLNLSYNLPHWQFGFEGSVGTAWYGDVNARNGRVENTHTVTNFRILGLMMYYF